MFACSAEKDDLEATVLPLENRPNIILILADDLDQKLGTIQHMASLKTHLIDRGVTVENFLVSAPMCCPSRINLLRGQYTHNHNVFNNSPPLGGFPRFLDTNGEVSTLAVWLQAAGYRTALIGKYLNGYPLPDNRVYVPPGWTEWYSPGRKNAYDGYDYYLNENGILVPYPPTRENFFTDVMNRKSLDFIERAARENVPFFLFLSTFAPHEPATSAARHSELLPDISAPRTPSFNETDIADKPPFLRGNPPLSDENLDDIDFIYRRRVLSMLSVDEMIADIMITLEKNNLLENTYVVFTSDQGFTLGQHRIIQGKSSLYEENIIVPFIIRGPGIPEGRVVTGSLAGMVDIAPTFAQWAGVVPPGFVDGRSFADILVSGTIPPGWRNGFLLEAYAFAPHSGKPSFLKGSFNFENMADARANNISRSIGIRTLEYAYMEHPDGFMEFYDLANDPYQLENIAASAAPILLAEFSTWLAEFSACRGESCRRLDIKTLP